MKNVRISLVLGALLLLVGCAHSVNVNHDYDTTASFAQLRGYRWMYQPGAARGSLLDSRIKHAVNEQLWMKGYREAYMPDFLVTYHIGARDRIDVTRWGYGYGRFGRGDVTVHQYTEGTLIIDVIDSRSMQLIWRSIASGTIDGSASTRERETLLHDAVAKMLKEFPPQRG